MGAPFHEQLVGWLPEGERQIRAVFRGAAKSTLTLGLILWACQTRRTSAVVWVRSIGADAEADREALERLARLAGISVRMYARRQLALIDGVPVFFRAPGGAVRGLKHVTPDGRVLRPDTAVIDDLETDESARSAMQTERLARWLSADLLGTQGHETPLRVIMLGTPIGPTSLIAKGMRRESPFDTARWRPPLVVPYVDADGVPAWPELYDPELAENMTEDSWANEYLLEPLPPGSLLFPPGRTRWQPSVPAGSVAIGVDPAVGGRDATGIVTAAMRPDGLVFTAAEAWHGHPEGAIDRIVAQVEAANADGHRVDVINVEAVGAFEYFAAEVARTIPQVPVRWEKPVRDKVTRAVPLTRWQRVGAMSMLDRLRGGPLDVELHSWQRDGQTITGHDDTADAAVWAGGVLTGGYSAEPPLAA